MQIANLKKNTSTIEVKEILEVLSQHNFSNQKQVEVLQILNFALYKKHYPQDLCGIMDKKIQLLQQSPEPLGKDNPEDNGTKRTQKVTTDVLMLLLHKLGISAISDDKAKMARLISYLTDFSEEKIRQRLSNTDELTSCHREEVDSINRILTELNFDMSIKYNKQR